MWAGWACELSAGRALLYWQSCSWPTATRGGRPRVLSSQVPSAAFVVSVTSVFVSRARQKWWLILVYYFENIIVYCSNCYTFSVYQGRLPQKFVPHLYCNCTGITVSLAHPAALLPSLVRLHSGFPLSVSIQCFHDRSAPSQLVQVPSEWNLQVGVCTVAYSRYQGGNKLMDWNWDEEFKIQYSIQLTRSRFPTTYIELIYPSLVAQT